MTPFDLIRFLHGPTVEGLWVLRALQGRKPGYLATYLGLVDLSELPVRELSAWLLEGGIPRAETRQLLMRLAGGPPSRRGARFDEALAVEVYRSEAAFTAMMGAPSTRTFPFMAKAVLQHLSTQPNTYNGAGWSQGPLASDGGAALMLPNAVSGGMLAELAQVADFSQVTHPAFVRHLARSASKVRLRQLMDRYPRVSPEAKAAVLDAEAGRVAKAPGRARGLPHRDRVAGAWGEEAALYYEQHVLTVAAAAEVHSS